jgi:hypothetical protein
MLGWILTVEYDQDGDGVRPPQDCVPTDPTAHPGGAEVPDNGVDEDCSGGDAIYDADHDGHPAANDCNDRTAAVHPGATDIPGNGIDEDCNGTDASTSAATATAIATPAPTTEATPASRRALLVAVDRRVGVPHGVPAQAACRGRMEGTVLVGRRRIAKVRLKLGLTRVRLSVRGGETIKTTARRRECRYQGIATVARSRVGKAISVSLAVKFYGNAHVRSSRTRWSVSVVRVLRDNS